MCRAIIIAILLSIALNLNLRAQQYHFRSYAIDEGLPQSEIRSILTDSRGYVWMGTQGGLVRYNGKDFKVFTPKDGLRGYYINALAEDKQGNILINTNNGPCIYDSKKFTPINTQKQEQILSLGCTPYGDAWFLGIQKGQLNVSVYNDKGNLINIGNGNKTLQTPQSTFFFRKNSGKFFFYSLQTRKTFEVKNNKLVPSAILDKIFAEITQPFQVLFQDSKDRIWFRTTFGSQNPTFYVQEGNNIKTLKLPSNFPVQAINIIPFEDKNGHIWFSSNTHGLLKYDGQNFQVFNTNNGLPHNTTARITQDREGNMWIATVNSGYGVIKFSGQRFTHFDKRDSLTKTSNWSVFEDNKGQIWAGFENQVARFNGSNFENYTLPGNSTARVARIFESSDQKIYAFTQFNSGVFQLNGKQFVNASNQFNLPSLPRNAYQEKDTLWLVLNNGMIVKHHQGKIIEDEHWKTGQWNNAGVFNIIRDKRGDFWLNSFNSGLAKYDGKTLTAYNKQNGLISNLIIQLLPDKWGRLWVACSNGLMTYENGQFIDRSEQLKIPSTVLYSLVFDKDGNLWAAHQTGVSKIQFDKKGKIQQISNYGKEEGFLAGEPNLAASLADSKGYVWFGGVKGITRYNPTADTIKSKAPVAKIAQMHLFLKSVLWDSAQYSNYHEGLENWTAVPKNLRLPYFENSVSFVLEALCFHSAEDVVFQWKLEGLDKEWSPETKLQEAVYTNLPPGKYTFLVKAKNKEGLWSETQKATFEVLKPFWAEWWFRILALLAIVGIIYLIFRLRMRNIKLQKARLEKTVEEKTAEVVQQKNEILEKNEELTQYTEELTAQAESLKTANQEISRKNEDITASINYAERIQTAILPQMQRIKKAFPNSFVLFKPRDIVSGDFYYFNTLDRYQILAAVDCTGHGVPGAFMSLIGNDLLNNIVNAQGIWQPDLILNNLHQQVRTALKQDKTDNRDGMDISVVALDITNNQLHFASAKGSLIYFQNGQMQQIKGDKLPVGGEQREDKREFTLHQVEVSSPTTFYLFSDGYADQFGGPNGKKFMVSQFRNLLTDIHTHPMSFQQKKLEESLENWMNNGGQIHRQLDDILVMGVKV